EQPEIVTQVHADYIKAGAKTHTLNTYSATPRRLKRAGQYSQIASIHAQAFSLLEQAIEQTHSDVDIAGSLGPLIGSYRNQPEDEWQTLQAEYAELVELQARADVLLIETMTNTKEATAAAAAAKASGKPYAVSFRLEPDGRLKSGESLMQAVEAVKPYAPSAILLNCSAPHELTAAMPQLASSYPCVGGYANAFESIDAVAKGQLVDELHARDDITPKVYSQQVHHWLKAGARVVGGCCEITPEHIQRLSDDLRQDGYRLVRFSELSK
ncbi:MAG: homocysteine S-methyltransferase family protein, partial [Hydrogenovibrio sp.]|uniref:homocysteine S-methyltransferase family protein n=1 Tax=Hydrogenovibrio sp. TaxID=2065821 RepID=UPI0028702CE3